MDAESKQIIIIATQRFVKTAVAAHKGNIYMWKTERWIDYGAIQV